MRLPALWLVSAFAAGIAAGTALPEHLAAAIIAFLGIILTGLCMFFLSPRLAIAGALTIAAWFVLGGLAVQLERAELVRNDAATLIARGALHTDEPLRWIGSLREDPESTPLGLRYTIDLQSVEQAGSALAVRGGLRLAYYGGDDSQAPPVARAGDTVEALCRARIPRNYLDPGAFDERGYLARQGIELLGSLRSTELLQVVRARNPSLVERLARVRGTLLARIDLLFAGSPDRIAVLRAMLLGDRNFVNSDTADSFQKTSAFHVLVLAGLHVAALAFFVLWLGRLLRLPMTFTTILTLAVLAIYLGVVQDRPPILRAALMTTVFLCARLFFRRVALLNTVALAAILLLSVRPSELFDSSFQLSFLAAGLIAGLAIP